MSSARSSGSIWGSRRIRRPSASAYTRSVASAAETDGRVTLLYSRPAGDFTVEDEQVALLYGRFIHEVVLDRRPPKVAQRICGAWVSPSQPTLLVVRGNQVIGGAVGRLPKHELEVLVRRALH